MPTALPFAFAILCLVMAGCSVITDFDECSQDSECSTGACVDGICEGPAACEVHDDCDGGAGVESYCIAGACRTVDSTLCTVDERFEEADKEQIHMGMLMPLSGRNGTKGKVTVDGTIVAINQINQASGGIGRKQVSLITCDTLSDPSRAVEAADHLVNDLNIRLVIGALLSDATISVAQEVTIDAGALLISPASTSPIITDLDDNDLVWRTVPSDNLQGLGLATLLVQRDFENVAIFYSSNNYGNGLFSVFQNAIGDLGESDRLDRSRYRAIPYDVEQGELQTESLITGADMLFGQDDYLPDVIIVIGSIESQQIIRALDETYFGELLPEEKPWWMLTDGGRDPGLFANDFGNVQDRIIGTSPAEIENAVTQTFKTRFEAQSDARVDNAPFADNAYDATFLASLAIGAVDDTNNPDPDQLHEAMALMSAGNEFRPGDSFSDAVDSIRSGVGIDYLGASGDVTLDPATGHLVSAIEGWATNRDTESFESLGILVEAPQ